MRSRDQRNASADDAVAAPSPPDGLPPVSSCGNRVGGRRFGGNSARSRAGRRLEAPTADGRGGDQRRPRGGGGGPAVLVPAWRDAEAGRALPRRRRGGFHGRRRRRRVDSRLGRRPARCHTPAGPVSRRHCAGACPVLGRRGALRSPVTTEPARKAVAGISESLISGGCGRICRAYQARRPICTGSPSVGRGGGFLPTGNPPLSPGEGTDRR